MKLHVDVHFMTEITVFTHIKWQWTENKVALFFIFNGDSQDHKVIVPSLP